jgi:phosphoesterase RecJ-like protein
MANDDTIASNTARCCREALSGGDMTDIRATRSRTARGNRTRRQVPAMSAPLHDVLAVDAGPAVDTDLDAAVELLLRARDVVLLAHIQPDADALGSALALAMGLPGAHLIVPPQELPLHPDLLVSCDVGSAERLGSLERLLNTCRQSLVIDHHASNTRFGQFHLVDAAAQATVILVARILDRMDVVIDRPIAENLYAGLATDTHHFRHADADTHLLAARLIDAGVRPAELMHAITDAHPFGWLTMLSKVLGAAVLEPDAARGQGLVYTVIGFDSREGMRSEELDSVIDIMRTAQEAGVAAVLKQTDVDRWQVSLRSQGPVNVAAVAETLGGGGHVRAAGFTHHGDPKLAVDALRAALDA